MTKKITPVTSCRYNRCPILTLDGSVGDSRSARRKLRGLILYDCCAYFFVDDGKETLSIFHAGETGAELAGSIAFK